MPIIQLSAVDALTNPPIVPPPALIRSRPRNLQLGVNQIYDRWEFQSEAIDRLYWQIDTFDPAFNPAAGATFRLLWTPAIVGTAAWRVGFVSIANGEVFDVGAVAPERNLDAVAAGGFGTLTISTLAIAGPVPAAEIAPGERVTVFLRRDAQAAADTINDESAYVLGASLEYA